MGCYHHHDCPFCNDCLRDQPVYTHGNNYQNQGPISNVLAQIGNYGNFIAYLVMGIPAGMLISKYGYKKTALIGLVVGSVGILISGSAV